MDSSGFHHDIRDPVTGKLVKLGMGYTLPGDYVSEIKFASISTNSPLWLTFSKKLQDLGFSLDMLLGCDGGMLCQNAFVESKCMKALLAFGNKPIYAEAAPLAAS